MRKLVRVGVVQLEMTASSHMPLDEGGACATRVISARRKTDRWIIVIDAAVRKKLKRLAKIFVKVGVTMGHGSRGDKRETVGASGRE